jgi:CubicO group peptidase (beta-lactamase class C family)
MMPAAKKVSFSKARSLDELHAKRDADFLKGLRNVYPVTVPNERPAYSNIAFSLIAYAIEAATGLTYAEQVKKFVTEPLGMTGTVPSPGDDARGVIPPGDTSWGSDYGISTA